MHPTIGVVLAGAHPVFANIGGDRWKKYVAVPRWKVRLDCAKRPSIPGVSAREQCVIDSQTEHPVAAFKWCDGLYDRETTLRSVFGVPEWEAEAEGEDGQWRWAEAGEPSLGGVPNLNRYGVGLSTFRFAAKRALGAARAELSSQSLTFGRGSPR